MRDVHNATRLHRGVVRQWHLMQTVSEFSKSMTALLVLCYGMSSLFLLLFCLSSTLSFAPPFLRTLLASYLIELHQWLLTFLRSTQSVKTLLAFLHQPQFRLLMLSLWHWTRLHQPEYRLLNWNRVKLLVNNGSLKSHRPIFVPLEYCRFILGFFIRFTSDFLHNLTFQI